MSKIAALITYYTCLANKTLFYRDSVAPKHTLFGASRFIFHQKPAKPTQLNKGWLI
jgi:hypothetical protein